MKKRSCAWLLAILLTLSVVTGTAALAAEEEAPAPGICLAADLQGKSCMLSVYLVDGEGATNGRVTVQYAAQDASLVRAVAGGDWVSSVNTDTEGQVAIAWAGAEMGEGQTLLATLYFNANKEVLSFDGAITELYRSGEAVTLTNMTTTVTAPETDEPERPNLPIRPSASTGKPDEPGTDEPGTDEPGLDVPVSEKYVDVPADHWAASDIEKVVKAGIFKGTSENTFAPDVKVDRAQFVTLIYRMAGEPEVEGASEFTDVASDSYYATAVKWCADNGIVLGVGEGLFAPDWEITREQMFTLLYRYAQFAGMESKGEDDLSDFSDADAVSDWAREATRWSVGNAYVLGSNGALRPTAESVRAEAATVICRFLGL